MESDKAITSMPSHHTLDKLFQVLNDSSTRLFHEMNIQYQESIVTGSKGGELNFLQAPIPQKQPDHAIWRKDSSLDLVFRLVMFFNSMPSYIAK